MSTQVIAYLGPVRSGKTWELVRQYVDALRQCSPAEARGESLPIGGKNPLDRTLWLAPNSRSAAQVRGQLLGAGVEACLRPGVVTFDELTRHILAATTTRLVPLGPLLERELLRRVVGRMIDDKKLTFYKDAARRAGFIDLLMEHIRELKRRGISPTAYTKIRPAHGNPQQHAELAQLYADYERQLTAHGLADADGLHWAARDALADGSCRRFQNLDLIVADGFTDFTRTQLDILSLLAKCAARMLISLPGDVPAPGPERSSGQSEGDGVETWPRRDLFAKVHGTLAALQREFPQLEIRRLAPRPSAWPGLDHVAQHIFCHPAQLPAPSGTALESLDPLEIVAAAGAHDEIVQIARRIKQRLMVEQNPGDIVVVFRSLADAAPRVREVFDQFGIPYSIESGLRLIAAPLVKTLLALLRLADEDWRFRRVISVLTNNRLSALDDGSRRAADWLVRDLQIAEGRGKLMQRVEQLGAVDTPLDELGDQARRRVAAAKTALPAFHLLSSACDELPKEATASGWCAALAQFGATLGLAPFDSRPDNPVRPFDGTNDATGLPDGQDCPSYDTIDRLAWECIVKDFAALERLDGWLGEPARQWTRGELIGLLIEIATHESLRRAHDEVGRVRVLGAPSARSVTARHVFLAGMSELAFPLAERAGRLAKESDYRFLSRAADQAIAAESAQPLPPTRAQEEMLLFYELLGRAEESLTISYPALDDKAQTLPPSPYVTEIERTIGKNNLQKVRRSTPQLSPVSLDEMPFSVADWRVQAVAQALGESRDPQLLAGILGGAAHHQAGEAIEAGLRIVHARAHGESFGPMEGLLTSPAIAARLAGRYGAEHLWSPSQLESYAACPYKFFLENVLGLDPLGDLTLEIDHRRRGSLMHDVLARFHRKLHDGPAEAWAGLLRDEARFAADLRCALEEAVGAGGPPREGIDAALVELDRRQIEKWIARYREQYAKYERAWTALDEPMLPTHFELRFGRGRPGDAGAEDQHSVDNAFRLEIGGEQILITGRIDRIDVGQSGGHAVFNVIDYKTGERPSMTRKKMEAGERLQPALYVMAAEALLFAPGEATPMWAGYWSMKNGLTTDAKFSLRCSVDGAAPSESWESLRPKVVARIGEFVHAIRSGSFPVFSRDHDCTSRCDFKTVCRVAQIRSLNKLWPLEVEGQVKVQSQESRARIPQPPVPSPQPSHRCPPPN